MNSRKFFANIVSHRDNGARIELNLRGEAYDDPGRFTGPPEDCYPPEREVTVRQCEVIHERAGTNQAWVTSVDFYEFSQSEQERFENEAWANMESDD